MPTARWTARAAAVTALALTGALAALPSTLAGAATSTLATSSDATWQTDGRVTSVLTVGRTTYLGGTFTSVRPAGAPAGTGEVARARLAAVDAVTGELLPWDPGADKDVLALAASPDGSTVYVGGMFAAVGGQARKRAAAVSATTGAVTAFAPPVAGRVTALATSGSRVYLGGLFTTVSGVSRGNLAAVDLSGVLVPEWDPVANALVRAITIAPDGAAVYVGGDFGTIDGNTRQKKVAKLTPTTGSILSFAQRPGYPVWSIAVTADSVYVGGDGSGGHASRFTPTGTQQWVVQTDGGVQAVTPLAGVLYVGGHFDNVCVGDTDGGTTGFHCPDSRAERHKLLAVDALTGAVDPWAPDANSTLGVFTLGTGAGRLRAGGDFTTVGVPYSQRQGFAQFAAPGSSPVGFRAAASSTSTTALAGVTLPTTVQAGDTLVLALAATGTPTADDPVTVTGWTRVGSQDDSAGRLRTVLWRKTAEASDAGAIASVTLDRTASSTLSVLAYTGARPLVLAASAAETTSSATHRTPKADVAGSGSWLLSWWSDASTTTTGWVPESDQVSRTSATATPSGGGDHTATLLTDGATAVAAGASVPEKGVVTPKKASLTAVAWSVVLQPAS